MNSPTVLSYAGNLARNVRQHANASQTLKLSGTDAVRSYKPGYIVLSYLLSFVGAFITLELIARRTGFRGIYNWYAHGIDSKPLINVL